MNLSGLVRVGSTGSPNAASVGTTLARTKAVSGTVVGERVSSTFARREEVGGSSRRQVATERVDAGILTIVVLLILLEDCSTT